MEYIQGLDGQISVFLHSLGIGFLLGVFYDAVCLVRAVLPGGRRTVFVTDIIYSIVCAFASFCFVLVLNDGRTLLYILTAQLLGWIAERLSLGAAAKHLGLLVRELAVELSNVLLLRFNVGLHDYKGYKEITHCDCERNHQYGTMPFL